MKHILSRLLSALLVAALLLSPVALMEEALEEIDVIEEVEAAEPVDEIVEEQSVDIVEEDTLGGDEVYTYAGESYAAGMSGELFAAAGDVTINATNFPDANFRNEVSKYDSDGNGSLSSSEIANVKGFPGYISIQDYTGIKLFTSLESLSVSDSATALDVSGLTSLNSLILNNAPLTSLNVSGCTSLLELYWGNKQQLTSIDVSGCTGLQKLECSQCQLTSLNVSGCTSLKNLNCDNNKLTSLDVSGCTSLEVLHCDRNQLVSLNVSGCTNLQEVLCQENQVALLDFSTCPNITKIVVPGNQLTYVNLSGCTNLNELILERNALTTVSFVSDCVNLETYYVGDNSLKGTLDLSRFTKLKSFGCKNNQLTSLNLAGLSNLRDLYCQGNKLKKLDISDCKKLVSYLKKGQHTKKSGVETYTIGYETAQEEDDHDLSFDSGVTLVTTASKSSSSSSSSKTKLANKKLKVTAYVGTPVQMETGGETGKSFKSSDKKIATVNSAGVVTPKSAGKCKITYKTSSANYTVTLTVKDLTVPNWVALNLKGTIAAKVGVSQTLTATMNDGAVSKLKWTTSDKKIATVKNGVVTFKKKGTVTITVTTVKGNKKAKVKFKVSK